MSDTFPISIKDLFDWRTRGNPFQVAGQHDALSPASNSPVPKPVPARDGMRSDPLEPLAFEKAVVSGRQWRRCVKPLLAVLIGVAVLGVVGAREIFHQQEARRMGRQLIQAEHEKMELLLRNRALETYIASLRIEQARQPSPQARPTSSKGRRGG
jgi:hypothetical protein